MNKFQATFWLEISISRDIVYGHVIFGQLPVERAAMAHRVPL